VSGTSELREKNAIFWGTAGTVTLAGDRLLILRENGELVMAPAVSDGFHPDAGNAR